MNTPQPSTPFSMLSASDYSSQNKSPEASQAPVAEAESRAEGAAVERLQLPPITPGLHPQQRADEVLRLAQEAFAQTGKWVLFYREMMGVDGVVRQLFPEADDLRAFETTPQFSQLLEIMTAVRALDSGKVDELEPQKMITVRLPKSQHEAMKVEAKEHGTSINKLCISKLLLPIRAEFVPAEKGKVRGRKPGPQGPLNRVAENLPADV